MVYENAQCVKNVHLPSKNIPTSVYMLQVKIDSQFSLSPKPDSSIIKARTQRKLRIT